MAATETATQLKEDIGSLMASYLKLIEMCYEALAPEATQRQRTEVRSALKSFIDNAKADN